MASVAAASMHRYLETAGAFVRLQPSPYREAAALCILRKVNNKLGKLNVTVEDGVGIALFVGSWGFLSNAPPRTTAGPHALNIGHVVLIIGHAGLTISVNHRTSGRLG